jgi:hypothetical protein
MQHTAGGRLLVPVTGERQKNDPLITELSALVARVQAITDVIDAAIASELASNDRDDAGEFVVLDDVTPCYLKANSALQTCSTQLAEALQFLKTVQSQEQRSSEIIPPRSTAPQAVRTA